MMSLKHFYYNPEGRLEREKGEGGGRGGKKTNSVFLYVTHGKKLRKYQS